MFLQKKIYRLMTTFAMMFLLAAPLFAQEFSGEYLPVFYVSDSRESVDFYGKLGFRVNSYYDYEAGKDVEVWTKQSPPIYIEMLAADFKFALHLTPEDQELVVGGMRHYFGVADVDAHREFVTGNGITASKIYDRPWMRMFYVRDPDGHVLFFFTRPEDAEK